MGKTGLQIKNKYTSVEWLVGNRFPHHSLVRKMAATLHASDTIKTKIESIIITTVSQLQRNLIVMLLIPRTISSKLSKCMPFNFLFTSTMNLFTSTMNKVISLIRIIAQIIQNVTVRVKF